jgi:acetyl-CoA carboxylase carboxyltransferase component
MTVLTTAVDPRQPAHLEHRGVMLERLADLESALEAARAGGGEKNVTRHHARGKLLPRERVELLVDQDAPFLELSPVAAWGTEFGVGASVVTGIGVVEGVECVLVANDPTVQGGAVNPYTEVKVARAAEIAVANRLPLMFLVESVGSGRGVPGRVAGELARLRVPTISVVFGPATADAAYVPALSDFTIAVATQARIQLTPDVPGQRGGPSMPANFEAEDERDGIRLARQCVRRLNWRKLGTPPRTNPAEPRHEPEDLLTIAGAGRQAEAREILARVLDGSVFDEFMPGCGPVAGWGEIHGYPVAVLAVDASMGSSEVRKAVQFVKLANGSATPLLLVRHPRGAVAVDVTTAALLLDAIATSRVPHLMISVGGTEPCGDSHRPRFHFRWPGVRDGENSRLDDDGVIDPRDTRTVLGICLSALHSAEVGR